MRDFFSFIQKTPRSVHFVLGAFGKRKGSGAGNFYDRYAAEHFKKQLYTLGCSTDLYHHEMKAHIDYLRFHDLTDLHDLLTVILIVFDLHQHQFPGNTLGLVECLNLNDIELFVELFFDLLKSSFITA